MNKTIGGKLFRWNITLVAVIMACAFLGINLFSEDIYKQKTLQVLESTAHEIEEALNMEDVESIIQEVDDLAFRLGGSIVLYDVDGNISYSSYQMNISAGHGMGRGRNATAGGAVLQNDRVIYEQLESVSTASGKSVLVYNHPVSKGGYISVQLPEEKMDDALMVFQELLFYVALVSLVVAFVGSIILSRHFSRPVVELKELANRIAQLDFSGRYVENREDEIGALGQHLNVVARELESKLTQLEMELKKEKTMDSMRTQFVAQASHELQTPLTILRNYVEAIQDDIIEANEMDNHVAIMLEEIDDMSDMVSSMLDLNQLRSGQFKIDFDNVEMTALLKSEVERIGESLKLSELNFEVAIDSEEVWIFGDGKRIKQALRNLIENGSKHSSGYLKLTGRRHGDYYRVSVENSGNAIPQEDLETLWHAFYKAKDNYKKGTGLGLAIVREIIEGHEGRYAIENTSNGVKSYFELKIGRKG
ncbi:MAG: HAMP domain-containing histidine kinase [Clostridia bacterium]|nr:HAMP domain-containing histidine kinase [Clostridia bacterium]